VDRDRQSALSTCLNLPLAENIAHDTSDVSGATAHRKGIVDHGYEPSMVEPQREQTVVRSGRVERLLQVQQVDHRVSSGGNGSDVRMTTPAASISMTGA
jgi:hypothetical protein